MNKKELIKYLDEYLKINDFVDSSKNGLQIDNSKEEIKKIGYAVDSNSYIFKKSAEEGVDMVLSHHGIYWGEEEVLVGVAYKRIKVMIDNDICSYAAHIPLDAHSEVGNNIGLAKAFINIFGLVEGQYTLEEFCEYKGKKIGFGLRFENPVHISNLQTIYAERLQLQKKLYNFGNKDYIKSIAFVSGGAGDESVSAYKEGYDVFVTGEAFHGDIMIAKELGQSMLLGGHYETEKIGPKLLAYHLRDKFGLEIVFLDEKY